MFQQDYIMRMIEQLSHVLIKVMGLRNANKPQEAQEVLNEAMHDLTGLSETAIDALSHRDLIDFVSGDSETSQEKCVILAELLKAKADTYADLPDMDKAINLYIKSFNVYAEAILANQTSIIEPNYDSIGQIINIIDEYHLPEETQMLLFRYFEKSMRYDKAEDVLFNLLEQSTNRDSILAEGVAFYERLMERDHQELEEGNLPIDEVLEGREKIQQIDG